MTKLAPCSNTKPVLGCYLLILLIQCFIPAVVFGTDRPATAFYYGSKLPLDLLSTYQRVVVEPDNVTDVELSYLKEKGVKVYAYFSIGEIGPERPWLQDIPSDWIVGTNPGWKSSIMDLTKAGWREYVINQQLQRLKQRGFNAFFLDTLDSYQLFAKTPDTQRQQQQGLVQLIRDIKQQLGSVGLLFNRGFEVVDQVADLCDGVVAESLFKAWDPSQKIYRDVNEQDRTWLTTTLKKLQDRWQLPITIIDYLPPSRRAEAETTAQQIEALGFIPWVSTPALDYMGVGKLKLIPRKILMLYDSTITKLALNNIHRFMALPVEYLGYVPEYLDISGPLPNYSLQGRYAGIISWTTTSNMEHQSLYATWILKQIQDKVRIAFMNTFPFSKESSITEALSLDIKQQLLAEPIELELAEHHVGFEIAPLKRRLDLLSIQSKKKVSNWIRVMGQDKQVSEPVFTSDWGGIALSPYLFIETENDQKTSESISRWIIDPFAFVKEALNLEEIPIADNTTENGRRILTIHIDGDGFYNKTEVNKNLLSPELITENFIRASQLPHTVSVIEGEISSQGLKPELSQYFETKAREIFALPNVELASHSYSHPFYWSKALESASQKEQINPKPKQLLIDSESRYILPIEGYQFNTEREIAGSINYINNKLAPAGKKTKVFLWSGDALPNEEAIVLAEQFGVLHMNGGSTFTRNGILSMTNIAPMGIMQGKHFQPYAPIQNENIFTNDWLGPFYGYQEVINTFKLTESPRRLKPISIYYHFYIGDKQASISSLERVYTWAKSQESLPLWISEYIPRIYGFREAVYEKQTDGWRIHHAENLKSLRLSDTSTEPNISASIGIAGYRKQSQGIYVSLTGQGTIDLNLSREPDDFPYLDNSNAQLTSWEKKQKHLQFRLKGHQAVSIALAKFNNSCQLRDAKHNLLTGSIQNKLRIFNFKTNDTDFLDLHCA